MLGGRHRTEASQGAGRPASCGPWFLAAALLLAGCGEAAATPASDATATPASDATAAPASAAAEPTVARTAAPEPTAVPTATAAPEATASPALSRGLTRTRPRRRCCWHAPTPPVAVAAAPLAVAGRRTLAPRRGAARAPQPQARRSDGANRARDRRAAGGSSVGSPARGTARRPRRGRGRAPRIAQRVGARSAGSGRGGALDRAIAERLGDSASKSSAATWSMRSARRCSTPAAGDSPDCCTSRSSDAAAPPAAEPTTVQEPALTATLTIAGGPTPLLLATQSPLGDSVYEAPDGQLHSMLGGAPETVPPGAQVAGPLQFPGAPPGGALRLILCARGTEDCEAARLGRQPPAGGLSPPARGVP